MNDPREERSVPMRTFDVRARYTIQKKVSVLTNDYKLVNTGDGRSVVDTFYTDWKDNYKQDHHTIKELLDKFIDMLKEQLRHVPHDSQKARELRLLLNDCYGWEVEEEYYEEA